LECDFLFSIFLTVHNALGTGLLPHPALLSLGAVIKVTKESTTKQQYHAMKCKFINEDVDFKGVPEDVLAYYKQPKKNNRRKAKTKSNKEQKEQVQKQNEKN
jgi:hypothetical protein